MRRSTIRVNYCFTSEHDYMFIAGFICIEMQGNLWMYCNMFYLVRTRLAENQEGIIFPNKPNRTRLRCVRGIYCRQPDHIFILEMSLYGATEFCRKVTHHS